MKQHEKEFNIERMAEALKVSRSGYYDFLLRGKSRRSLENERLTEEIKEIHKRSRGVYGSPRIYRNLRKEGESVSRKRVARLMQKAGVQAKMRKHWKRTTKINAKAEVSDNYLNQNFTVKEPNKVWASDITYIDTQEGWLYVAVVMDLFSRKIVGLSMGNSLETELISKALKQALLHREVEEGLMQAKHSRS